MDGNSYCNDRRDLDLCRDAALLEHDWRCVIPQCGQPYDRSWIENTLLQIVRQRERLFHLQDLVCSKCCQVHHSIISLLTSSFEPEKEAGGRKVRDMRFETTFSQLLCQVLQKTLAVLLQGSICTPLDILMCALVLGVIR